MPYSTVNHIITTKLNTTPAPNNPYQLPSDPPYWNILLNQCFSPSYIRETFALFEDDAPAILIQALFAQYRNYLLNPGDLTKRILKILPSGDIMDIYTGEIIN